jgi:hypothetical protein
MTAAFVAYLLSSTVDQTPSAQMASNSLAIAQTEPKSATTRTVPITKQTHLEGEMRRFLLVTHQADATADVHVLFQVPLLRSPKQPRIGIYKFGLNSAHDGYNVVFQYPHHLVFSSARSSAPLLAQLQRFWSQCPSTFSQQAQRAAKGQLLDIVVHNQTAGESALPSKLQ